MKRFISLLIVISISFTLLCGCSDNKSEERINKTGFLFDTVVTITLYGEGKEQLLEDCFEIGEKYEQMLSRTIESSEINQINQANGTPVTVSDETLELLKKGLEYCELSGGVFDITIAPASTLWDFKSDTPALPDDILLTEAISHVDYHTIQIDGNQVWLEDENAAIDLGGIAKGFIADKLKEYLVSKGETSAIINLGGNIQSIGVKPDGTKYQFGIQYPFKLQGEVIDAVSVEDSSMVSSGIYERYFKIDDVLYHHILDPATGYPVENNLLSVTILSPLSVDGDGLSTTCYALGLEKGMELIKSLDGIEAVFITDDYELHYSYK